MGPYTGQAVAQPALQRTQALPFQPVLRVAVGVALRNERAAQALAPALVVALRAGQVQLSQALGIKLATPFQGGLQPHIIHGRERQAARLQGNQAFEGQQFFALQFPGFGALLLHTAALNALREIHGALALCVESRVTQGHAAQA